MADVHPEFPADVQVMLATIQRDLERVWVQVKAEEARLLAQWPNETKPVRLQRLNDIQRNVEDLMARTYQGLQSTVPPTLSTAYEAGAWGTAVQMGAAAQFAAIDLDAAAVIAKSTMDDMLVATQYVNTTTKGLVKELSRDRWLTATFAGTTAEQAGTLLAADLKTALEPFGIHAIQYANGAKVGLPTYADMVVRTKTALSYQEGGFQQGKQLGVEWWEIMDGPDCGLSFHDDPDLANGLIVDTVDAEKYPISHPNCVRVTSPRPDITSAADAKKAQPTPTEQQQEDQAAASRARAASYAQRPRKTGLEARMNRELALRSTDVPTPKGLSAAEAHAASKLGTAEAKLNSIPVPPNPAQSAATAAQATKLAKIDQFLANDTVSLDDFDLPTSYTYANVPADVEALMSPFERANLDFLRGLVAKGEKPDIFLRKDVQTAIDNAAAKAATAPKVPAVAPAHVPGQAYTWDTVPDAIVDFMTDLQKGKLEQYRNLHKAGHQPTPSFVKSMQGSINSAVKKYDKATQPAGYKPPVVTPAAPTHPYTWKNVPADIVAEMTPSGQGSLKYMKAYGGDVSEAQRKAVQKAIDAAVKKAGASKSTPPKPTTPGAYTWQTVPPDVVDMMEAWEKNALNYLKEDMAKGYVIPDNTVAKVQAAIDKAAANHAAAVAYQNGYKVAQVQKAGPPAPGTYTWKNTPPEVQNFLTPGGKNSITLAKLYESQGKKMLAVAEDSLQKMIDKAAVDYYNSGKHAQDVVHDAAVKVAETAAKKAQAASAKAAKSGTAADTYAAKVANNAASAAAKKVDPPVIFENVPRATKANLPQLNPDRLTRLQTEAIKDYTGSSYKPVNTALRSGRLDPNSTNGRLVREVSSAMQNTTEDLTVIRKVTFSDASSMGRAVGVNGIRDWSDFIGSTFTEKGFMSTSFYNPASEGAFGGNVLLKILMPKGSKGINVSDISHFRRENEWLVERGSRLRIVGVNLDGHVPELHAVLEQD